MAEIVREPHFYDWSIFIDNEIEGKPLASEIVETLSRTVAFDYTRKQQRPIICDNNGMLYVRSDEQRTDTIEIMQRPILAVGTLVVDSNPKRKQLRLQNIGLTTCFISYQNAAIAASGWQMRVNQQLVFTGYTGPIYAIDAAATALICVLETISDFP